MAAKKSLEVRLVDLANELLEEEYKIYSDNLKSDEEEMPEEIELLLKDMDITKKHLEQLAFLLRKYHKK